MSTKSFPDRIAYAPQTENEPTRGEPTTGHDHGGVSHKAFTLFGVGPQAIPHKRTKKPGSNSQVAAGKAPVQGIPKY